MPFRVIYTDVPFEYSGNDVRSEKQGRGKDKTSIKSSSRYCRSFPVSGYDKHETRDENEDIGYANSDPTNNSGEMKYLYKHDGSYYQHVDRYCDKSNDGSTDKQKTVDVVIAGSTISFGSKVVSSPLFTCEPPPVVRSSMM